MTNGNSLRLLNRDNSFSSLTVTTEGGNFQIASDQNLSFNSLSSAGGSVVLDTSGSISGNTKAWLTAGSVSFRAGGSVKLDGFFAAANGSGQSVWLNNQAAASVLNCIKADSSVTVTGSSVTILTGEIVGSSSVTIATTAVIARDSSIVSHGGTIEFTQPVVVLFTTAQTPGFKAPSVPTPGLRLDAGHGGHIALGGSLGNPTMELGWVEIIGRLTDQSTYGIFARQTIQRRPGS